MPGHPPSRRRACALLAASCALAGCGLSEALDERMKEREKEWAEEADAAAQVKTAADQAMRDDIEAKLRAGCNDPKATFMPPDDFEKECRRQARDIPHQPPYGASFPSAYSQPRKFTVTSCSVEWLTWVDGRTEPSAKSLGTRMNYRCTFDARTRVILAKYVHKL